MPTLITANCFKLPGRSCSKEVVGGLPDDWLKKLINQLDSSPNSVKIYNYYVHQVGPESTYQHKARLIAILTSVYHLITNPEITSSRKNQILFSLPKEASELQCTPGFHNRLEQVYVLIILPSPTSLDELTAQLRYDIVNKTARKRTDDTHDINDYFIAAHRRYGVFENNPDDPHRGFIDSEIILEDLTQAFTLEYTFFKIINYTIHIIKGELEGFGYTGLRSCDKAYTGETIDPIIAYLRIFLKEIPAANVFLMDDTLSYVIDINWAPITKFFIEELVKANYFSFASTESVALETFKTVLSPDRATFSETSKTTKELVKDFIIFHRTNPAQHLHDFFELIVNKLDDAQKIIIIDELIRQIPSINLQDFLYLLSQIPKENRSMFLQSGIAPSTLPRFPNFDDRIKTLALVPKEHQALVRDILVTEPLRTELPGNIDELLEKLSQYNHQEQAALLNIIVKSLSIYATDGVDIINLFSTCKIENHPLLAQELGIEKILDAIEDVTDAALLFEHYTEEQKTNIIPYIAIDVLLYPHDMTILLAEITNKSERFQQIYFDLLMQKKHRLLYSAFNLLQISAHTNQNRIKNLFDLLSTHATFQPLTKHKLTSLLTNGTEEQITLIRALIKQPLIRKKAFPSLKELTQGIINCFYLQRLFDNKSPDVILVYLDLLDKATLKKIFGDSLYFCSLEFILKTLGKKTDTAIKFVDLYGIDNCLLHCWLSYSLMKDLIQFTSYISEAQTLELSKQLARKGLDVNVLLEMNRLTKEEERKACLSLLRKSLPSIFHSPEQVIDFLYDAQLHARTYDDSDLKKIIKIKKIELKNSGVVCIIVGIVGTGICAAAILLPAFGLVAINTFTLSLALVGYIGFCSFPLGMFYYYEKNQMMLDRITTTEAKVIAKPESPKI